VFRDNEITISQNPLSCITHFFPIFTHFFNLAFVMGVLKPIPSMVAIISFISPEYSMNYGM